MNLKLARLTTILLEHVDKGDDFRQISLWNKLGFIWCFGLHHDRDTNPGEPDRNWDVIESGRGMKFWVNVCFRSSIRSFVEDQIEDEDVEPACAFFGIDFGTSSFLKEAANDLSDAG